MPRVHSTQPIAVKQAQLVNPNAFQLDTSITQAVGGIGDVMQELSLRKQNADDSLAMSKAMNARKQSDAEIQQMMLDNPDPNSWQSGSMKIRSKHMTDVSQYKGVSKKARGILNSEMQAYNELAHMQIGIATTKKSVDDAYIFASASHIEAIGSGDEQVILETRMNLEQASSAKFSKDESAVRLAEIEKQGVDLLKKNGREAVRNVAVETPVETIERIDAELKLRSEGKESDFIGVESRDLNSARQLAKSTIVSNGNAIDKQYDIEIGRGATEINKGIIDKTMTEAKILEMKFNVDDTKRADLEEWREGKISYLRATETSRAKVQNNWALVDDIDSTDQLDSVVDSLETGQIDTSEALAQLGKISAPLEAGGHSSLTKPTFDRYRKQVVDGGKDAIEKATSAYVSDARNVFLTQFTEKQLRFESRKFEDLTLEEQREARSVGFMIQVGKKQLSMFERELDLAIRNRTEDAGKGRRFISGDETTALAATIWEKYRNKTPESRIADYKMFSGVNAPVPAGIPKGVWKRLTAEEQAAAVGAEARGADPKDILGAIKRGSE